MTSAAIAPESDDAHAELRGGLLALAVFFTGFLGWAALAPLDAAVVGQGVVVVSGNRQTVQHRDGGVVSRLAVVEGQKVSRNQVLVELGAPELIAQERVLTSQTLELSMQRARLLAEVSGAQTLERPPEWVSLRPEDQVQAEAAYARYQQETASGAWSEFDARIKGFREELASLAQQEALLSEELTGMRDLAKDQLVPLTRVRALERSLAELRGRRAELNALIATTQQDRADQIRQVEAKLAEAAPRLAAARVQLDRTRIRAPTDGVVVGLTAHTIGGVIRPGERIMDIVPQDQGLVIEAKVRPEDADDLAPGQNVEVRITAFSGRNLPLVTGAVRSVSADRFVDDTTGKAYFLTQVGVSPRSLAKLTKQAGRTLRAGLPAQVVIPTRKRTALQYLVEPLNQAIWSSFREG